MLNSVILMGRLTRDPDYKKTQSDISVCKFSIAVERKFQNKQTGERETDFIDCQAWRGTADFISRYFSKGSMVAIEGELQNNNWTDKDGNKRYSYIVQVNQVHFCGSKNDSAQSSTSQAEPAQTGKNNDSLFIGELGEFEQVLGNGEVPF